MGMNDRKQSTAKRKPKKAPKVEWAGYVDMPLSASQKEDVASEYELVQDSELIEGLAALMESQIDVKLKSMDGQSTVACQLMDMNPDSSSAGFVLTSYAPDARAALFVALYKHNVLCEGVWDTTPKQRAMWG